MSNCKIYKITLSPVDWFFFGGEMTYGGSDQANYYAKSKLFPQESSIVGMLRYEILKKEGLLQSCDASMQEKVRLAIGESGFNYDSRAKDAPIGKIFHISPVMLQYEENTYYQAPFNSGYDVQFLSRDDISTYINGDKVALPYIKNFEVKEYYGAVQKWLSLKSNATTLAISTEDVFVYKTQIGITKKQSNRAVENKEGFFKGELCKLNRGYQFVFYAQLGIELDKCSLINLGAERSMFAMNVEEELSTDEKFFLEELWNDIPVASNQITFLSEAFVPDIVFSHCSFAWTDTIAFRCITRPWKAGNNYAALNKDNERSDRYNLLKRGSVLYYQSPNDREMIVNLIHNPYLQRFGYNIYK